MMNDNIGNWALTLKQAYDLQKKGFMTPEQLRVAAKPDKNFYIYTDLEYKEYYNLKMQEDIERAVTNNRGYNHGRPTYGNEGSIFIFAKQLYDMNSDMDTRGSIDDQIIISHQFKAVAKKLKNEGKDETDIKNMKELEQLIKNLTPEEMEFAEYKSKTEQLQGMVNLGGHLLPYIEKERILGHLLIFFRDLFSPNYKNN